MLDHYLTIMETIVKLLCLHLKLLHLVHVPMPERGLRKVITSKVMILMPSCSLWAPLAIIDDVVMSATGGHHR